MVINSVYLVAFILANIFISQLLPSIVSVPGDEKVWLEVLNIHGPVFWANLVLLFSCLSANFFCLYGTRLRRIQDPSDVKGCTAWWLGILIFNIVVFAVCAVMTITNEPDLLDNVVMLLMYLTLGIGLYWITTLLWSPPSVKMAPWGARKVNNL